MRGRALIGAALLAACSPVTPPGLVLDVGRGCEDIELVVADPDVLPGWRLHAAAIPGGDEDAAWYLASENPGELALRRVPEDIPELDLSAVGQAREFTLQRGPGGGQVWLALDRDERAQLWRVDEASATIQAGPAITDFPTDLSPGWIRRVVFLGQSPYLLALPRTTRVGEIAVEVAAITPELALGERWALAAKVTCPPFSELNCPLFWEDLRSLTVLDVAEPGSVAGAALLLGISTPDAPPTGSPMPKPFETHIVSVTVQRDPTAERPVLIRRDHTAWATTGPVRPWPAQIAADPLGLYVLIGLLPTANGTSADATGTDYLYRAELLGSSSTDDGEVIASLSSEFGSHLLQLGSRVALGQKPGEYWYVAPIEGASIDEDIVGSLRVGESAGLLRAGGGQIVVVADERPSARVQIACDVPGHASEPRAR